ncbi:MAG: hypothetical protein RLZZ319_312 [Actinomycetota bacterium]
MVASLFRKRSRTEGSSARANDGAGIRIEFTDLAPDAEVFLGQSAYLFLRFAESAARHAHDAIDLESESNLAVVAEECFSRFSALATSLDKLGVDRVEAMSPFIAPTREFERRTRGRNWVERVACTWVTMAFLQDFWRRLADGLPASVRAAVVTALKSDHMIDVLRAEVEQRLEREPTLRPMLALWARRLVGDTMLVAESALVIPEGAPGQSETVEPVFTELIAAHSRRMDAMGLTA